MEPADGNLPPTFGSFSSFSHFSNDEQLRTELRAAVGALRDLGPRYEPELVDSVMDRLRPRIDRRIEQRSAQARHPAAGRSRLRSLALGAGAVAAAIILGVPGVAAAITRPPHGRFARPEGFIHTHEMHERFERQHRIGALPKPLLQPVQPVFPAQPAPPVPPAPPAGS